MKLSRLTSKYQATVPADVRAALGVGAGDTLQWDVVDGVVSITKRNAEDIAWTKMAEESFAVEWLSEEDEEAFRDL